ncbi:MAG: DNA polymerase III subunit beta [Bacilli bacterium]|nr:DNA polymerase III subunit beta [Bacilli bacterium]MDD4795133.1 DNA polymerase III subunit beta [Bacilli bacterium]
MKLLIEKGILLESLTNVMRAISPKNIIPILNGVKFDLEKEGLYITASDSDITIKTFIDKKNIKKINQTGCIIIQSKYLLDIIRKMPNTDINIEVVDGLKIIISTEKTIYNLNCLNTDDYPKIELEEVKNPIIIASEDFKKVINQTLFAVSTQESRPLLTGLNVKINANILECTATDSYRLAKKTLVLDSTYDPFEFVIPGKNISELDKLLTLDNNVEIHPFNNKILFKYENYLFQSSLLSGTYPNTTELIPNNFEIIATTLLNDFYHSIDRAALLTQNKDKNIIKMETKDKTMLITSNASEIGKVEETVDINKNNSNNLSISFSSKYMLDALKTFEEEELLILLNTDSAPIVLKSTKDESLIQLILPIKTY